MTRTKSLYTSAVTGLALAAVATGLRAQDIDRTHGVASADGKTLWYDGRLVGTEGQGWTNTAAGYDRLPATAQETVPPSVWGLSRDSAGIGLRFVTDSASVQVRWVLLKPAQVMPHMPATGSSGVDVYVRESSGTWRFVGNGRPGGLTNTAHFAAVPGAEHRVYLPLYNGVRSVELGLPADKTLSKPAGAAARKPAVFYGTSITQGGCASRPGLAATAIVGRQLDIPVINLGFSGSGRMEPVLADLLAELDPSVYVLDCLWNMSPDLVSERVAPFVKRLRQARPLTPILLVEDSSYRAQTPTGKGKVLRAAFDTLQAEAVEKLYFLSNEGMLGDDFEGTVDGCHPNDLGMMRQADVFIRALKPLL